jgi:hypothetical protein
LDFLFFCAVIAKHWNHDVLIKKLRVANKHNFPFISRLQSPSASPGIANQELFEITAWAKKSAFCRPPILAVSQNTKNSDKRY